MTTTIGGSYPAVNSDSDATINGLTVGKGGGAVATNTAVGASALAATATGGNNVAIGYQAATATTTGTSNVSVGNLAFGQNTTGSFNTAVGAGIAGVTWGALGSNTTGANNTAMGYQALLSNTTASYNTAVGYQAGYSNTTGSYNVFIGPQAGHSNTTNNSSVCIGLNSGYTTTGYQNTFIGTNSGYSVTTGNRHTIVGGYNGNQGGLDITTANNYIVLSDGDGNPRVAINSSGYLSQIAADSRIYQGNNGTFTTGADNTVFSPAAQSGIAMSYSGTSNVPFLRFWNGSGQTGGIYVSGSNTSYNTSSDYRLKENVKPMTGALETVTQLKPVIYDWISDKSKGQGFIAHELQSVIPDCVTGEKDAVDAEGKPVYQGIDTSFLVATLTAAIQELKAEVDALKAGK